MKNNNFEVQLRRSKLSVNAVAEYLRHEEGITVVDTQDDQRYWDKDIDLILKGKPSTFIEVKCDSTMRKMKIDKELNIKDQLNLYIEETSCVETNSKGWLKKSKADDIYYVDYRKGRCPCHIFKLDELKKWIRQNEPKFIEHRDLKDRKKKRAYLISISDIETLKSYRRINLPAF